MTSEPVKSRPQSNNIPVAARHTPISYFRFEFKEIYFTPDGSYHLSQKKIGRPKAKLVFGMRLIRHLFQKFRSRPTKMNCTRLSGCCCMVVFSITISNVTITKKAIMFENRLNSFLRNIRFDNGNSRRAPYTQYIRVRSKPSRCGIKVSFKD